MTLSLFKKCISGCLRSSAARLVWIQKASSEASVTGVSLSRITLYLFFYYCYCQSNYFCLLSSITFFIPSSLSSVKILTGQCHGRPLHKSQTFFFSVFNPGSWLFSLSSFLRKYSSSSSVLRLDFTNHKHFSYWSLTLDLGFSPFPFFSANIQVYSPSSETPQITNIFTSVFNAGALRLSRKNLVFLKTVRLEVNFGHCGSH